MRSFCFSFAAFYSVSVLGCIAATGAAANPVHSSGSSILPGQILAGYNRNVLEIKGDAERQQMRDGGNLTPEHAATYQRRLDQAHDLYVRTVINHNPISANADGSPLNPRDVPVGWTLTKLMQTGI